MSAAKSTKRVTVRDEIVEGRTATLAVSDTPTAQLIDDAKKEVRLKPDSKGRVIELRKPGPLAQFRLVKVMGPLAANHTYMQMILPLIFVSSIDGDPVGQPTSDREVEALIERLGEEGVANVNIGVMKHYNGAVQDPITGQFRAMTADEAMEASKEVIKK